MVDYSCQAQAKGWAAEVRASTGGRPQRHQHRPLTVCTFSHIQLSIGIAQWEVTAIRCGTHPAVGASDSSSSGGCTWVFRPWIELSAQLPQMQYRRLDVRSTVAERLQPGSAERARENRTRSQFSTADSSPARASRC